MAYANKLDTDIITAAMDPDGNLSFYTSTSTVELDEIKAYYTFIKPTDGTLMLVYIVSIADEIYKDIDALINP